MGVSVGAGAAGVGVTQAVSLGGTSTSGLAGHRRGHRMGLTAKDNERALRLARSELPGTRAHEGAAAEPLVEPEAEAEAAAEAKQSSAMAMFVSSAAERLRNRLEHAAYVRMEQNGAVERSCDPILLFRRLLAESGPIAPALDDVPYKTGQEQDAAGALVAAEHLRHVLIEQLPENDRVLQAFRARKPIEWD